MHTKYYLPTEEIKNCNAIIDGGNFFDQPIKNYFKTYDNIRNIASGQGDDYITGCLLGYNYFKKHYRAIAIGLNRTKTRRWSKSNTTN